MFSKKDLIRVIDIGLIGVAAIVVLYILPFDLISQEALLTICAFLGYPTLAALRELFVSKAMKTRIFAIVGMVVCVIYGYGYFYNLEWFDPEKFKFILYLIFGFQGVATLQGAVKANFKTLQD